jgi:GDPmannose 4,6-dehydratase
MKTAFVTGILGQDGIHLSKFLLEKDYRIFGLLNNKKNPGLADFLNKFPNVNLIEGDLTDLESLNKAIKLSNPDEIYNLGGLSSVSFSFSNAKLYMQVNGKGTLNLLEATKNLSNYQNVRFYQASSSEMYGKVTEYPQNEITKFNPISPYGESKVYAHNICKKYREFYGMQVSCGILYNHESEYRSEEFVTRKITKSLAKISQGKLDKIKLGTLDSKRDWGYAGDYIEAMWLMLQNNIPDDFVVATGETHSVRDFLSIAVKAAGLKGNPEDYVLIDDNYKRPAEVNQLVGDASKAKRVLGWEPKVNFEDLVLRMLNHDMKSNHP